MSASTQLVPPHVVAGIVDAADGITAAAVQLVKDPHPDRCDRLAERLRATLHGVERLRRQLIEADQGGDP